jgi:DNA-binding winged helix-turn-helix (wHTH) protein
VQFHFSDHLLDSDRRELRRGEDRIAIEPQVFDLLVYLVENRDRVVRKDDLIANIWDGRIVSESTLTSRINAARNAVADNGKDQKLIRTIQRRGFRFVGAGARSWHPIAGWFVAVAEPCRRSRARYVAGKVVSA